MSSSFPLLAKLAKGYHIQFEKPCDGLAAERFVHLDCDFPLEQLPRVGRIVEGFHSKIATNLQLTFSGTCHLLFYHSIQID